MSMLASEQSPDEPRAGSHNARLIREFWRRMNRNDFAHAAELCAEHLALEWPQSGERIRGRKNFALVNEHYPANGPWRFTVRRVAADELGGASDVEVTDGVVSARAVSFFEIQGHEITNITEYWPDPFEPADWRTELTERTES